MTRVELEITSGLLIIDGAANVSDERGRTVRLADLADVIMSGSCEWLVIEGLEPVGLDEGAWKGERKPARYGVRVEDIAEFREVRDF